MHTTTRKPNALDRSLSEIESESRLRWLLEENAREAYRRSLFRSAAEEEEMQLMRRPLDARRAYATFGLLLGTLPPAMIFVRIFGYGFSPLFGEGALFFILCLIMNIACCVMGRKMGAALSRTLEDLERQSWSRMLLVLPFMGAAWGSATGAVGGLLFFFVGAFFGLVCALPVGILAFTIFTPLHRLVARGGMIDARHFWPLACGITMMISALILGI